MALSDSDVQRLNQQLAADPQWAQLVQAATAEGQQAAAGTIPYGDYIAGKTPAQQAILQYYASHNIPLGPQSGNNAVVQPDGTIKLNHPYRQFAKEAAISAGVAAGGALAAGALSPAAATTAATGGTGAAAGGAAATTAATAATGGTLLHALLPTIIGAGSSVAGTAIASHANTEAAKIAAAQADKALAVQQQQYALQREDTAPYRALGQGAVNNLGFLSGIDTTSNLKALSSIEPTVNPPPSTAVAPGAVDANGKPIPGAPPTSSITPPTMAQQQTNNRTLSQVGGGGTVRIQDPQTGLIHLIPQSDAAAAQQAGGRLV